MRRIRWLTMLLVVVLLGGSFTTVIAQDYNFTVPRADVVAFIEADGTMTIEYTYVFENRPGASPIDFVDIGMPAGAAFDFSDITADVDGQPIRHIANSTYTAGAIELGLEENSIPPGETGTVNVQIRNLRNVLFRAEDVDGVPYAEFQFQPNYFDSSAISGRTDMAVTLVLPPGLNEDEPRYMPPRNWPGETAPGAGFNEEDRIFYTWESTEADLGRTYIFGASFPARVVPEDTLMAAPVAPPPGGQATVTFDSDTICMAIFCLGFAGLIVLIAVLSIRSAARRKLQYLPPKISVEGHGIKRGLTAVEAAILMEQPMDKIITMILFSVLRKEAAEVKTRDPLDLEIASPLPEGLQPYEIEFLQAFQAASERERRTKLQDVMVGLVKSVSQKMKGFSHKETVAYYEDIMRRAWEQVETAETPEVKGETFEEVMPWTMLDRRFEDRTRGAFGTGPVFVPVWWWRYDPTIRPQMGGGAAGGGVRPAGMPSTTGGGSRTIQLPNLPGSDFAASMVNSVQNFSAGVIGSLADFTGGITNRTNPPPKPTTTYRGRGGGGGGGGRSCACACACAGCACACAGGGR